MLRHIGFNNVKELLSFIKLSVPAHVYYSSAYYISPSEKDMDLKGWEGADLIFDIDADHIPTPCKEEHDRWSCLDCGAKGRGLEPTKCPNCGGRRIKSESFYLCKLCLEAARDEVLKLIEEFLIPDLGFSSKEIQVAFSGRRGYHVHVESELVKELDQYARRELVDYIKAVNVKPEAHGYQYSVGTMVNSPTLNSPGWRGKIARGIYSFLSKATIEELRRIASPTKRREIQEIIDLRESILRAIEGDRPKWHVLTKYGKRFWFKLIEEAIKIQRCEVDERVTTDLRRLIRLPGSLHGDTGLIAKPLSLNDLDSFDPLRDSIAFKEGEVEVFIESCPQFELMDQSFGPFEKTMARVPTAVAVCLLGLGVAKLSKQLGNYG